MDFEWDPQKAHAIESRHGVSFPEACEVFDDDHSSTVPDPDLHKLFPDSESVNRALREYVSTKRTAT